MKPNTDGALLDEYHAAFIQRRVSINVASRDAGNLATVARALGCRVSSDRRQVTLFLAEDRAAVLLDNVRQNGAIAVVFSRPSTHETIQLKGEDAIVAPLQPGDAAIMGAYLDSFSEELLTIGYTPSFARSVVSGRPCEVVAVAFTPSAAFRQTPGPAAGRPLAA